MCLPGVDETKYMYKYVLRNQREVSKMVQLAIYLEEQLAERLDKVAKASGKSKSKWVAEAIQRCLQDQWPDGFFDLAGSWQDDAGPDEILARIRAGMQQSDSREKLLR
jgi:predicted transcriptional regulator